MAATFWSSAGFPEIFARVAAAVETMPGTDGAVGVTLTILSEVIVLTWPEEVSVKVSKTVYD